MEWLLAILMWLFAGPAEETVTSTVVPTGPRAAQSRTLNIKDDGTDPKLRHRLLQYHIIVVEDTEFRPAKNSDRD